MTLEQARKKINEYIKGMNIPLAKTALDDGEYFIFSSADETEDDLMIGVHKETGEVIDYFPPKHPAFLDAVELGG